MTNQYVPDLTPLGSGDLARSADVNDRYDNTVSGFDRLPTPKVGEQGFSAAVPVGTPVNADHATTKNWVETAMTSQVVIAEGHADDAEAAKLAAQTSEANALSSANNASSSAGTATTKANEAATSASNALASENSASTDAATATAQAGIATTQAGIATTKASEALSSANAAQTAETNAVAAYDSFDDRYLGPKASDPALDNDGNALLTGALYFDTNNGTMKVYNGTSWDSAYVPPNLLTLDEVTNNGNTTTNAISVGALTATNASVNFTNIGTTTSTTDPVLMITAAGLVEKKTLGSNAFNSTVFDNYQGWQLNGGSSTEAIGKNETVTFVGSGGASVTNSGNTVTINSTDTNTTNFNVSASAGTAENISAGETIDFSGSGGIAVTRTGNNFTIDGSSAGITEVVSDTTPQLGGQLDANGNTILMGVNTITDTAVGNWNTAYNDKITTVAFDINSGNLTLNQVDGGTVVVNLDGRYGAITGSLTTSTTFGGDVSGTYNSISVTNDSHGHSFANLLNKGSGTGTYTTTGAYSAPLVTTAEVRTNNGTQLVLNGGDSSGQATGQTGEKVYLNAENGIEIVSSPDNWASGWAGRKTATINDSNGASSLPGTLTTAGAVTMNSGSNQVQLSADGAIELTRSGAGAYIDFKNSTAEDNDVRIQESSGGINITGSTSIDGIATIGGTSVSGGEGGEIRLTAPPTTNLSGDLTFDLQTNSVRFFESGGTNRGAALDLTDCAASAASTIWHSGNDGSGSGLDADLLDGLNSSSSDTASTIVARNSAADIFCRLVRSTYPDQSTPATTARIIFRNDDGTSDNFLRAMTNTGFVGWLNNQSGVSVDSATSATTAGTITNQAASATTDTTNASNITSGTLAAARVANLAASKITSGTFATARIPTNISITGNAATATSATSATTASRLVSTTTTTATNKTLADGEFCTVTASGRTITLPASPTAGDRVYISVGNFTDTTVGRNSQNIMGLAENMTIDKAYIGLEFVYSGNATQGWRII